MRAVGVSLGRERQRELQKQLEKAARDDARLAYRKLVKSCLRELFAAVDTATQRAWASEFGATLDPGFRKFFVDRDWYHPALWADARPFLEAKFEKAIPGEEAFLAEFLARRQASFEFDGKAAAPDMPLLTSARAA